MNRIRVIFLTICLGVFFSACSAKQVEVQEVPTLNSSGTIIISGTLPARSATAPNSKSFAPLLGYARSNINYLPANNEYTLEVSRAQSLLKVKLGDETIEEFAVDGALHLDAGSYVLERKENNPSWYASNEYFSNRKMEIPFPGDTNRFLRGALGQQAFFASSGLIIHTSPIWSSEVGGLKVDHARLKSVFDNISLGTVIIVR